MLEENLKELIKEAVREVLDERGEGIPKLEPGTETIETKEGTIELSTDELFHEMLNTHGLKRGRLGASIELDDDEDEEPENKRLRM